MSNSDAPADWLPLIRLDGRRLTLKEVEEAAIDHAMLTGNNLRDMARQLGIGRSTLYRKLRDLYEAHVGASDRYGCEQTDAFG